MRMTNLFQRSLRDDPADAEVDSHRLLIRAGYIRRVASGVYSWLPLGKRVLTRVEQIVREEMDQAGAQELVLPIIQPLELWARSGRDQAYGPLMFRLTDRKETPFALAPTAEEVITDLVGSEYSSYRDLPVNLYQIQWKYRDELRPRFGLLRGREFLMKDAYSFDLDGEGLASTYATMFGAYQKIFTRVGLTFRAVQAQAGEIGGDVNHEFMAVAAVGEDDFVWCPSCEYAANTEAARRGAAPGASAASSLTADAFPAIERVATPGSSTIEAVSAAMGVPAASILKTMVFLLVRDDGTEEVGVAVLPGDRELNELALPGIFGGRVRLFEEDDFQKYPHLVKGFIGPNASGLTHVILDRSVDATTPWVIGGNEPDVHVRNAQVGRDIPFTAQEDISLVLVGDPCPQCGAPLAIDRGIEVGHCFQLGTKYSVAMGASYIDEAGDSHPMVMGCYGIGVSRVIAAVLEEHHDEHGITWPSAIAPFAVHLLVLAGKGDSAAATIAAADAIYEELRAAGHEVLYDDRAVSPGVKFADADLLGMPLQLIVGAKGLERGVVETKDRRSGTRGEVARDQLLEVLKG